ncbi:dihydrodipicolinate synthase family protein [Paenibacillus sp. JCM 10914]|uniref:dihydrodipicolinate synthase family protein n=1 Tax=Paenibacillus sp. JCM 10914 TaxID=1236974 RepID=UPI000A9C741F
MDEVAQMVLAARKVMDECKASLPIVVGTGTNDTMSSVQRTEAAAALGADAVLVVTPYYSRPSDSGIIEHFRRIAAVGIPVILYEVPLRTGIALSVDTIRRVLDIPGIIGMKDSTLTMQLMEQLAVYDTKPILCGHDLHFHDMLVRGAAGGILATANWNTDAFSRVYQFIKLGHYPQAEQQFSSIRPFLELLTQESNPAPMKWLLKHGGMIATDTLRLPMTPISEELKLKLTNMMHKF